MFTVPHDLCLARTAFVKVKNSSTTCRGRICSCVNIMNTSHINKICDLLSTSIFCFRFITLLTYPHGCNKVPTHSLVECISKTQETGLRLLIDYHMTSSCSAEGMLNTDPPLH